MSVCSVGKSPRVKQTVSPVSRSMACKVTRAGFAWKASKSKGSAQLERTRASPCSAAPTPSASTNGITHQRNERSSRHDGERGFVAARVTRDVVDRIRRPRRQSVHVVEEQPLLQHDADRARRIRVAHPAALEHESHVVHRAGHHLPPPPSISAISLRRAGRSACGATRRR